MKPSLIVLWVTVIGVMASGLFHMKYAVQEREDQLANLNRELIASEKAVHVLNAEWSYLNRPERLAKLAAKHLNLQPMAPEQLGGGDGVGGIMVSLPVAGEQLP